MVHTAVLFECIHVYGRSIFRGTLYTRGANKSGGQIEKVSPLTPWDSASPITHIKISAAYAPNKTAAYAPKLDNQILWCIQLSCSNASMFGRSPQSYDWSSNSGVLTAVLFWGTLYILHGPKFPVAKGPSIFSCGFSALAGGPYK